MSPAETFRAPFSLRPLWNPSHPIYPPHSSDPRPYMAFKIWLSNCQSSRVQRTFPADVLTSSRDFEGFWTSQEVPDLPEQVPSPTPRMECPRLRASRRYRASQTRIRCSWHLVIRRGKGHCVSQSKKGVAYTHTHSSVLDLPRPSLDLFACSPRVLPGAFVDAGDERNDHISAYWSITIYSEDKYTAKKITKARTAGLGVGAARSWHEAGVHEHEEYRTKKRKASGTATFGDHLIIADQLKSDARSTSSSQLLPFPRRYCPEEHIFLRSTAEPSTAVASQLFKQAHLRANTLGSPLAFDFEAVSSFTLSNPSLDCERSSARIGAGAGDDDVGAAKMKGFTATYSAESRYRWRRIYASVPGRTRGDGRIRAVHLHPSADSGLARYTSNTPATQARQRYSMPPICACAWNIRSEVWGERTDLLAGAPGRTPASRDANISVRKRTIITSSRSSSQFVPTVPIFPAHTVPHFCSKPSPFLLRGGIRNVKGIEMPPAMLSVPIPVRNTTISSISIRTGGSLWSLSRPCAIPYRLGSPTRTTGPSAAHKKTVPGSLSLIRA
ncbi:hypothetical protein C8R44DRAFT_861011 [Mycena epipterygia]|nr:hypothetical protein C8R44DRAFT_861011 [Mycena epipterygia]